MHIINSPCLVTSHVHRFDVLLHLIETLKLNKRITIIEYFRYFKEEGEE